MPVTTALMLRQKHISKCICLFSKYLCASGTWPYPRQARENTIFGSFILKQKIFAKQCGNYHEVNEDVLALLEEPG